MERLTIDGRAIGNGESPYFIAEIGANHNGDMKLCRKIVDAAVSSGADAVKFQSWSKSSLCSKAEYQRRAQESSDLDLPTLEEQVEQYSFGADEHREIQSYCREKGVSFLSSCFSLEEADLLAELSVGAIKIASMDVNHLPLLAHVGSLGIPVILSTGMATLGEIERAVDLLAASGAPSIVLLHCVALYPPEYEQINLRNIATLKQSFGLPVGFSDHSIGSAIPLAAVALGACVIEKHFTLDKGLEGWDHAISADPLEMEVIVREGRNIFEALGTEVRRITSSEIEKRRVFRRRVVLRRAMKRGETLSFADFDYKRPGTGIAPDEAKFLVGRQLRMDLEEDHELEFTDLA